MKGDWKPGYFILFFKSQAWCLLPVNMTEDKVIGRGSLPTQKSSLGNKARMK